VGQTLDYSDGSVTKVFLEPNQELCFDQKQMGCALEFRSAELSGWPTERATSQQVDVQMGDSFSSVVSTIDHDAKSGLRYSQRFGRFLRLQ
jgi:hypothetical protein